MRPSAGRSSTSGMVLLRAVRTSAYMLVAVPMPTASVSVAVTAPTRHERSERRACRSSRNIRTSHGLGAGIEDGLNGRIEEPRDGERQGQTGIVPLVLDRVDSLTRHAEALGEVRLRPAPLGAEDVQPVLHR